MSNACRVWITLIVSISVTTCVAILVCGLVLGQPTLLITGAERLRQAEEKAVNADQHAHYLEGKLWHYENPGRD